MRRLGAGCVVLALLALAGCADRAVRAAAKTPELGPGKILVASRDLRDPNFYRSVVLLAQHNEESAMGLVINRPTRVPMSKIFTESERARDRSDPVHLGGPVLVTGVLALLRAQKNPGDSLRVMEEVYLISNGADLDSVIRQNVPRERFRVYMGYAGWGPHQLENEIEQGGWHVFDADADLVFDANPFTVWERLIRRTERVMVRTFGWRPPAAPAAAAP